MKSKKVAAVLAGTGILLGIPSIAGADIVGNDVVRGTNDVRTTTEGQSADVTYTLQGENATKEGAGGLQGCNASSTDPVTVTVIAPAGVTANPSSFEFTGCGGGNSETVSFTSSRTGDHTITHEVSGPGVNRNNVDFTLRVDAAPVTDVAPTVTAEVSGGTLGDDGWYRQGPVELSWAVTGSPAPSTTGCEPVTVSADQPKTTYTCDATNSAGAASDSAEIGLDATAPTVEVTGVADGGRYDYGSVPTPACDTTDATSGVATAASLSGSVDGVGSQTVTCSGATDHAGNASSPVTATFSVQYESTGLLAPINTGSGTKSAFRSNANIPVKVQLIGGSAEVTDADLRIEVTRLGSTPDGSSTLETVSATNAHTGDQLRYSDGQYIFNLSAKSLGVGQYRIEVQSAGETIAAETISIVR